MSAQLSNLVSVDSQTAWKIIFASAHPLCKAMLMWSWQLPGASIVWDAAEQWRGSGRYMI